MSRNWRPACPSSSVALAFVALVTIAAGARGQPPTLPKVGAQLVIESPRLTSALGSRKATIEASVSAWLIVKAGGHFGFLTWVGTDGPAPPTTRWIVRLQDDWTGATRATGTNYFLEFFKVIDGGPELEIRDLPATPFDSDRNPFLPTDDADAFAAAVEKVLQERLDNEDFRNRLSQSFLYTISLTSELEINADVQALLLPFSFRDLKAASGSKLAVHFQAPLPAGAGTRSGGLILTAAACLSRPAIGDRIQGKIESIEYPQASILQPCFWDAAVADLLQSVPPGTQKIQMKEYRFDDGSGDLCLGSQPVVSGP